MKNEEQVHQVVLLSKQGLSRRAIARVLKVSRNTVRKILAAHEEQREEEHTALPEQPERVLLPSKLDPFRGQVTDLLNRFPDITAQRIFEELRQAGFAGGHSIVKELVHQLRPTEKKISLPTPNYGPGQMAESDWSSYLVRFTNAPAKKMHAFAYVLNYSRRKCYSFHGREDLYALMDGHEQAFARLQGAAHACKYDNQKPVVLRWEGRQPIYNMRFVDFATYYEFSLVACRPFHPNDKPHVERSFYELEKSFLNGRSFRDEADLHHKLKWWQDEVCDKRHHPSLKSTALERFIEEQPHLQPLPAHPYDTARVVYRLCDLEGCIAWDGNRYEVPYEYVTDILPLRVTARELFVYAPDLRCVARHELRARSAGERARLPGRRPPSTSPGPDLDQLRVAYEALGPQAAQYLAGLKKSQHRSAAYHARKILALRERYRTQDLLTALEHALQYQAFDHRAVERILFNRAEPRRLEEYVAEATALKLKAIVGESHTEPRGLEDYDALPCLATKGEKQTCPPRTESPAAGEPRSAEEPKKKPPCPNGSGSI